uniref:Uncharacterized protein n=1 Tax=Anolis carolinensis TaxID=28377 RepID=H9G613_ANOCA
MLCLPGFSYCYAASPRNLSLPRHQGWPWWGMGWESDHRSILGRAVCVVESGLVPSLVLKLRSEPEEIQVLILDTLWGCLRTEAFEALASGAVRLFKEKLAHPDLRIRSRATQALMAISVPLEGKEAILGEGLLPDLVSFLWDRDPQVQANAAGTLMFAAVATPGKLGALEAGALEALVGLSRGPDRKGRLFASKALRALAEAPRGRHKMLLLGHGQAAQETHHNPGIPEAL